MRAGILLRNAALMRDAVLADDGGFSSEASAAGVDAEGVGAPGEDSE